MKKQKAFTIIELVVVCAIIATLATTIFVSFENSKAKSRNAKRVENMDSVRTALGLYHEDKDSYPVSYVSPGNPPGDESAAGSGNFFSECNDWSTKVGGEVVPGLVPDYLPIIPKDSLMSTATGAANDKYCYLYASDGTDYAFIFHYSNDTTNGAEVDWLAKPELVDQHRACSSDSGAMCHESTMCTNKTWVMPTKNSSIHAWKVYSEGGRCW